MKVTKCNDSSQNDPFKKDDPFQNPWVIIQAVLYLRIRKLFPFPIISLFESTFYKRETWSPFQWNMWHFYLPEPTYYFENSSPRFEGVWGEAKHLHTVSFMSPNHASFLTSPGTASFSELQLELSLWSYSSLIPIFRCQGEPLGDTDGLQSVSLVLRVLNKYSGRVPVGTGKRGMPQETERSF